jgi:hypothetical protein
LQVREKLVTMGFYVSHHTDAIDGRIEGAALEASRTCVTCGKQGRQRKASGRVACNEHAQVLGVL